MSILIKRTHPKI